MEVQNFFQGSFELFHSLKKILHIGGQVIEGFNSSLILSSTYTKIIYGLFPSHSHITTLYAFPF
jgi:hypothetical protein